MVFGLKWLEMTSKDLHTYSKAQYAPEKLRGLVIRNNHSKQLDTIYRKIWVL
mgnify:CR=1 FL=1